METTSHLNTWAAPYLQECSYLFSFHLDSSDFLLIQRNNYNGLNKFTQAYHLVHLPSFLKSKVTPWATKKASHYQFNLAQCHSLFP